MRKVLFVFFIMLSLPVDSYAEEIVSLGKKEDWMFFYEKQLPERFPRLISYLRKKPLIVKWNSQTNEPITSHFSLTESNHLVVYTTVIPGTIDNSGDPVQMMMTDINLDAQPDITEYVLSNGEVKTFNSEEDQLSSIVWSVALVMSTLHSGCCD